jgi:hypothetical protein
MRVPDSRGRDRDLYGRPRNSRLRDELGRPLPRDAAVRAAGRAAEAGEADVPDGTGGVIGPGEAADLGGTLLIEGRPFHAHEVFEDAWKSADEPDRDLWRGLAQVAVGLTHARRGNARGAVTLLYRGAGNLRRYAGSAGSPASATERLSYGVDATFVASAADELAARIERDGLAAVPAEALLLRLRPRRP